jgi:hypothetical protein
MRYGLSRTLMSLAVAAATIASTTWVATTTLFHPDRPARIAEAVLATPEGQQVIARTVTDQVLTRAQSAGLPTPPAQEVEQATSRALTDPRLSQALHSLTQAPAGAERTAAAESFLTQVAGIDPRVEQVVRGELTQLGGAQALTGQGENPAVLGPLAVLVPAEVNDSLSTYRDLTQGLPGTAAWVAAAAAGAALVLGPRRDVLARRAGRWALIAGGAGFAAWVLLPHVILPRWDSVWAPILTAGLQAAGLPLAGVFTALVAGGAALYTAGVLGRLGRGVSRKADIPAAIRQGGTRAGRARRSPAPHRAAAPRLEDPAGDWSAPTRVAPAADGTG